MLVIPCQQGRVPPNSESTTYGTWSLMDSSGWFQAHSCSTGLFPVQASCHSCNFSRHVRTVVGEVTSIRNSITHQVAPRKARGLAGLTTVVGCLSMWVISQSAERISCAQ